MWILVHKIFVGLTMSNLEVQKMPKIWLCQIGIFSPKNSYAPKFTSKLSFYIVDTGGHWCKILNSKMPNLSLKIFHRSTVLKLVLKFKIKLGDPKPYSISILWPISKITKILAPESARIPKYFQSCVILGHPSPKAPKHFFRICTSSKMSFKLVDIFAWLLKDSWSAWSS